MASTHLNIFIKFKIILHYLENYFSPQRSEKIKPVCERYPVDCDAIILYYSNLQILGTGIESNMIMGSLVYTDFLTCLRKLMQVRPKIGIM